MASMYWLKLYHEMLDDPKMGMLPDRLYRRVIELLLLAGQADDDGYLPELKHIAFRLRIAEEHLETDLVELAKVGIVQQLDGRWHVTNFAKRQAPIEGSERVRRHRERKRKEQYYRSNESETNRYIETDTDTESDIDTYTEQQQEIDVVLKEFQLSHSTIQELKQKHTNDDLSEAIDVYRYMKRNGRVDGPGYLIKYLREGWAPPSGYKPNPNSIRAIEKYHASWSIDDLQKDAENQIQ